MQVSKYTIERFMVDSVINVVGNSVWIKDHFFYPPTNGGEKTIMSHQNICQVLARGPFFIIQADARTYHVETPIRWNRFNLITETAFNAEKNNEVGMAFQHYFRESSNPNMGFKIEVPHQYNEEIIDAVSTTLLMHVL